MHLCRLVYFSTAGTSQDIAGILTTAKLNNKRKQITGALWFDGNYFLQTLEGDRQAINKLFQSISKDDRHSDVTIAQFNPVKERKFSNWSMGFYSDTQSNRAKIMKYSSEDCFNPNFMTSENLTGMMTDPDFVRLLA